jgi:ribosomal protein L13E
MTWHANAARDPKIGPLLVQGREVARASGYSRLELQRVGLSEAQARERGIPIDQRRNSSIGANVMQLRLLIDPSSIG